MLYIIGWGVLTLITLRIVQAGLVDRPRAMQVVTAISAVIGLGFVVWLAAHAYLHGDPPALQKPEPSLGGLPKL